MRVAIVQSNYVPWKGYFDLIAAVDELILLDDVQYTRRDWRNRNRIKTPEGVRWLTIPVRTRGAYLQRIEDVTVADPGWGRRHWETLRRSYRGSPHFQRYAPELERLYAGGEEDERLTAINERFLRRLCEWLEIPARLTRSSGRGEADGRTQRLVRLCLDAGADHYVSGPAARAYLEESQFARAGITVSYMSYAGYPQYPQPHGPFEHAVSVLDLLLNTGPDAPRYMKHVARRELAGP